MVRLPSVENNLSLHPISIEFHPSKNGKKTPEDFTLSSARKVWWLCEKNHEWEAKIANRTKLNSGCPYCSGKLPSPENNLSLHQCSKEFHPTLNKGKTPRDFSLASHTKVWWTCEKGHKWEAQVINRTKLNSGCPYCSGNKPSKENNLSLHQCSKEFLYEKNHPSLPEHFTLGSEQKIWWKCKKNHEWKAKIYSRTILNSGCPFCKRFRSKTEIALFEWCKETFPGEKIEANNRKVLDGLEIDIYFSELNKGIEFNGDYYHSFPERKRNDKRKLKKAKEKQINILVIKESLFQENSEKQKERIKRFIGEQKPLDVGTNT